MHTKDLTDTFVKLYRLVTSGFVTFRALYSPVK